MRCDPVRASNDEWLRWLATAAAWQCAIVDRRHQRVANNPPPDSLLGGNVGLLDDQLRDSAVGDSRDIRRRRWIDGECDTTRAYIESKRIVGLTRTRGGCKQQRREWTDRLVHTG